MPRAIAGLDRKPKAGKASSVSIAFRPLAGTGVNVSCVLNPAGQETEKLPVGEIPSTTVLGRGDIYYIGVIPIRSRQSSLLEDQRQQVQ